MASEWVSPFRIQKPFLSQNLATLRMHHPALAAYASSLRDPGSVRVRETERGVYEAQRILPDGGRLTYDASISRYQISSLCPRIAESVSHGSELVVLTELGVGAVFQALSQVFSRFQEWQLLAVERDALWIAVLIRLVPLAEYLGRRRLYFATSERDGIRETVERFGMGNRGAIAMLPGLPQDNADLQAAVRAALESDYRRQNNLAESVTAHYRDNQRSDCQTILCTNLWEGSAGGWMLGGIGEALAFHNRTVHRLTLATQSTPPNSVFRKEYHSRVLSALDRLKPDLILSVQHELGYFLPSDVCEDLRCPNAVYSVDTFPCEETPGKERRLCICGSEELYNEVKPTYPLSTYMPYATAVPPILPLPSPEFECSVSFLGNAGRPKEWRATMEQTIRKYGFIEIAERIVQGLLGGGNFFDLCRAESLDSFPEDKRNLIHTYVLNEQLTRTRTQFLRPLIPFGLRLYGSTWQHVTDDPEIRSVAYENVPYSLRFDVYASSTINIDISWHKSPSVRFFEVPAVRAFMLAQRRDAYLNYLSEDEAVYFSTPDELVEKVDHFLAHPEDREPYMEKGYRRACLALTWRHWANGFFSNVMPVYLRILSGSDEEIPPNAGYPPR